MFIRWDRIAADGNGRVVRSYKHVIHSHRRELPSRDIRSRLKAYRSAAKNSGGNSGLRNKIGIARKR